MLGLTATAPSNHTGLLTSDPAQRLTVHEAYEIASEASPLLKEILRQGTRPPPGGTLPDASSAAPSPKSSAGAADGPEHGGSVAGVSESAPAQSEMRRYRLAFTRYMPGGWANPHREQQTIPQGQTSIPPKSFSTPTANGQSAPRSGSARGVGRGAGSHTPSTASESFSSPCTAQYCMVYDVKTGVRKGVDYCAIVLQ